MRVGQNQIMAREDYTAGVFEEINAASLDEVFEQQARNIEILQEELAVRIEELKQSVEAGELGEPLSVRSIRKIETAIYQKAFMDCVEIIQDKAMNFLVTAAVSAVVTTNEFNYDLYVNHLLSAMEANRDKIIALIPKEEARAVEVKVNLNVLGKPEEWGKAIEGYRKAKKIGKITKQPNRGPEVGSKIWREKIYGVGREGGGVTKVYSTKPSKDVTEKYKNKYRDTVAGRLAFVKGKAPFWYLIEHGNTSADLGTDSGGVPYPVFGPTHFARNSEEAIASAFKQIWEKYFEAAREIVRKLLVEHYKIGAPPIETEEQRRVRLLKQEVREIGAKGELKPGGKLQSFVETEKGRYEAFLQGETIRVSLRDPKSGRWIALEKSTNLGETLANIGR